MKQHNNKVSCVKKGYLLLETLVVIVLFALLSGTVVFNTTFFNRSLVRTQLQKIQMLCHYLQWRAISTGVPQEIIIDVVHNGYSHQDTHHPLPPHLVFGIIPHVKGPPAHPTHTIEHPVTFPHNRIVFNSTGIVSAGTVYIKHKDSPILYALTNAVSHVSLFRLYRYSNHEWTLL